jgi:parvulin-like peptidyl-prolyl isomerase
MKPLSIVASNIFIITVFMLMPSAPHCEENYPVQNSVVKNSQGHGGFIEEPVAKVNGEIITVSELMLRTEKNSKYMLNKLDKEMARSIKKKSLDELIDEKIFLQHAKSLDIKIPEEEVNKQYGSYKGRFKDEKIFSSYLELNKLTENKLLSQTEDYLLIKQMIKEQVDDTVKITDEDIKKGYEVNLISYFTKNEKMTIHDIVFFLEPDTDETAQKVKAVLDQVKNKCNNDPLKLPPDETFAIKENIALDKNKYGKIFEAAKKINEGELLSIIDNYGTLHIIQLLEYKPEVVKSREEARPILVKELRKKFRDIKLEELKTKLHKKAAIEILDIFDSFDLIKK